MAEREVHGTVGGYQQCRHCGQTAFAVEVGAFRRGSCQACGYRLEYEPGEQPPPDQGVDAIVDAQPTQMGE